MNLISYGENRIFVDIAYYGCGSGCQYCYTIKPNEKQKLITVDDKNNIINSLLKTKNLCDKIVSFSPNTEPFKSTESINTFTDIIREISTSGVYIQISTKEAMDVKCIELLNSLCKKNGQIIINVSLPFLTNTKPIPLDTVWFSSTLAVTFTLYDAELELRFHTSTVKLLMSIK